MHQFKLLVTYLKQDEIISKEEIFRENMKNIDFNLLSCLTTLNTESKILERKNDDYIFTLDIKNEQCSLELLKEKTMFDINVDYADLFITDDKIKLEYMIETDDKKNTLIIERINNE